MQSIVVFCGSNLGNNPIYASEAKALGYEMAKRNIRLVYGAGNVGLMGIIADAVLEKNGQAVGVIPGFLKEKEVCHQGLTELFVVKTLDERKVKMAELSDGVIVLPGGYGTLDELFEMLTLVQLGQDKQPIGILNTNGYFDSLLQQVKHMHAEGFLKTAHKDMFIFADAVEPLLDQLFNYEIPDMDKWLNRTPNK